MIVSFLESIFGCYRCWELTYYAEDLKGMEDMVIDSQLPENKMQSIVPFSPNWFRQATKHVLAIYFGVVSSQNLPRILTINSTISQFVSLEKLLKFL